METFFWGNQWWKPSDQPAFARWLASHGSNYSIWARNHPGVASRVFGGSRANAPIDPYAGLNDQATSQVDAEIKANIDAINKQRDEAQRRSTAMMGNAKDLYAALAGMLGSVGPQIADTTQKAVASDSAMARGFADAQEAIQKGEAGNASDFLKGIGAPQAQIDQVLQKTGGSDAGDVVYGLGGALDAQRLNESGTAAAHAASMLPAGAISTGMQQIGSLASDAMSNDKSFQDEIDKLNSGRGSMIDELLLKLRNDARATHAMELQDAYYGHKLSTDLYKKQQDLVKQREKAAAAAAAAADKARGARTKAAHEREAAFDQARREIYSDAAQISKRATSGGTGNPFTNESAPKVGYAQASKILFDKYKYLLRYATAAGKPVLRKRLNQMIKEALNAAGIRPGPSQVVQDAGAYISSLP